MDEIEFILETVSSRPDICSLLIVLIVLTTVVCCYTGLKRGEVESIVGSNLGVFVVGLVVLLGIVTLQVLAMYLLPILVFVSLLKILILNLPLSAESLLTTGLQPAQKLMIVVAFGDNLADWLNCRKEFSFRRYLTTFSWTLFPAYFTIIIIAWIITKVSAWSTNSDTVPGDLFSLPQIVSSTYYNAVILTVLVLFIALTSYWRWRKGKPWGK